MIEALKNHLQKLKKQNQNPIITEKIDYMINLLEKEEINPQELMDAFEEFVLVKNNRSVDYPVRKLILRDRENRRIYGIIMRLSIQGDSDCGCQ